MTLPPITGACYHCQEKGDVDTMKTLISDKETMEVYCSICAALPVSVRRGAQFDSDFMDRIEGDTHGESDT